jgi:hypothetical protein
MKMKQILALCLMLAALLLGVSRSSADVASTSLKNLTRVCRRAVVCKVIKILDVEGVKIAEAEVLMTLKGAPTTNRVYFIAEPISIEDTSHAAVGETLLLFLLPEPSGVDESSRFRTELRKAIGSERLWLIAWSGRGRLSVKRIGQTDYVPVLADAETADVRFPKNITTIPLPGSNGDVRLAKLVDVVGYVKRESRRDRN